MNGPVRPTRPAKAPPVTSGRDEVGSARSEPPAIGAATPGWKATVARRTSSGLASRSCGYDRSAFDTLTRGDRRAGDRRAVGTGRGHLAPADPVAEVGIGEHELTFRRERSGERRLQPEDVEPSLPGAHTHRRRDDVERHLRAVHRERQTRREVGRGASGPRRAFGLGEGPVGVGVDLRAELHRGDLGQVDHVVDPHLARRELDPRVPVDREVAERVGRGGARSREHDRDHAAQQDRSADGSSHRPASSLASVMAAASACWIEKFGFVASAAER